MFFFRFSISMLTLLMAFQSWGVTVFDGTTQRHYWNTERMQYEHAPKGTPIAHWNRSPNDGWEVASRPWQADPCPVPDLLHRCSSSPGGESVDVSIRDDNFFLAFPCHARISERDIFLQAPKQSPPYV